MADVKWACPRCACEPGKHGKGGRAACLSGDQMCYGFVCECDDNGVEGTDTEAHGQSLDDQCHWATCHHCGWAGVFPPAPFKLTGWAKKAWAAGWRPPAGWQP